MSLLNGGEQQQAHQLELDLFQLARHAIIWLADRWTLKTYAELKPHVVPYNNSTPLHVRKKKQRAKLETQKVSKAV